MQLSWGSFLKQAKTPIPAAFVDRSQLARLCPRIITKLTVQDSLLHHTVRSHIALQILHATHSKHPKHHLASFVSSRDVTQSGRISFESVMRRATETNPSKGTRRVPAWPISQLRGYSLNPFGLPFCTCGAFRLFLRLICDDSSRSCRNEIEETDPKSERYAVPCSHHVGYDGQQVMKRASETSVTQKETIEELSRQSSKKQDQQTFPSIYKETKRTRGIGLQKDMKRYSETLKGRLREDGKLT